jgi:hypothetical protein
LWLIPSTGDFFKGAALGAAGLVVTTEQTADAAAIPAPSPVTLPTIADAHDLAYAQAQSTVATPPPRVTTQGRPASDFMVDVLKKIGFEYAAINPGSTFQGLHESLVNYGKNTAPSCSRVCTRRRPWRWRMGTPRRPASRCSSPYMAPSACSTRRWRCSRLGPIVSRLSSSSVTIAIRQA